MKPEQKVGELSAEVQGNVLCGFSAAHARFAFYRVIDPEKALQWINDLEITNGGPAEYRKDQSIATTIALTCSGLAALGVREEVLAEFPEDFRAGMRDRWRELGDPEEPQGWDSVFCADSKVHILLSLYADDCDLLDPKIDKIARDDAIELVCVEETTDLKGREHFGFRDGISQPVRRDGADLWKSDVPISEFLIFKESWRDGSRTEDDPDFMLAKLGTFLVYRKLEQDVFAFRDYVQLWMMDADHVAAKIMGRWPNGTPVKDEPLPEEEREQADDENGFTFADDKHGVHCPVGAHIRRANPRQSLPFGTDQHRMLRRGRPYGAPLPAIKSFKEPVPADDGEPRGLLFVALVSEIARQFEFVQSSWINEPTFHGLDGSDPIAATTASGNFRMASGRALPLRQFVTVRGGDYLFMPGMEALGRLVANEFG